MQFSIASAALYAALMVNTLYAPTTDRIQTTYTHKYKPRDFSYVRRQNRTRTEASGRFGASTPQRDDKINPVFACTFADKPGYISTVNLNPSKKHGPTMCA